MTRGILYIVFPGDPRTETMLARSIASLKAVHPELPCHVERLPEGSGLLDKARMYNLSPYDETLFLDADTVVMGRLDYGFDRASRHGLACTICECPWARRFAGLADRGDLIEWNTGVMFFTRAAADVFTEWKANATIDSSVMFVGKDGPMKMPENDQAGFAMAVEQTGFNPAALPLNWNFRHRWQKTVFGPVKIWHDYDDVPESVRRWSEEQSKPGAIMKCAGWE
jgi:hypothetical protein